MMRWVSMTACLALFACAACDKSGSQPSPASSSSTQPASAPTASAPTASAAPSGSSAAAPAASGTASKWAGTYKSDKGSLYYPTDAPNGKEWKDLAKWQGDNASVGMGEGALTIEIGADGRVTGEIEGRVGPATINGTVEGGTLTARVDRKDPSDKGLTGTATAKVAGDKVEGAMRLSSPDANAFRTVTFSAAKK